MIDTASRKVTPINIPPAREPAHIVYSHDGQWVYTAHVTRALNVNPRRTVAGRDVLVSRFRVGATGEMLRLPDIEGNFGLTGDTRQSSSAGVGSKEDVALSLAPSPDGRSLFVSAGTKIMRVRLSDFKLHPWSATVELPCRLACVKEGWENAWTVYALGSYYKGDGAMVDEFKTHLYTVLAPRN